MVAHHQTIPANKTDNTDSTAQAETSDGEKNPVTIRFYNYALSETAKADWWENTIANFEKENDWIDIETVTVDYNSIVSTFILLLDYQLI